MKFLVPVLAAGLLFCALPVRSQATSKPPAVSLSDSFADVPTWHWRAIASGYTFHYSNDSRHRPVGMLGFEHQRSDKFLWGGTIFTNSFGQPSTYWYAGEHLTGWSKYPELFAHWTAGLMYGYRGEFKNKVPFNINGFSPGVVVALGWQFSPVYSAQVNVLGNSALMFQVSVDLK